MFKTHAAVLLLCGAALAGCSEVPQGTTDDAVQPKAGASTSTQPAKPTGVVSDWTGDAATLEKISLCSLDAVNGVSAANGMFITKVGQPLAFDGWLATPDLRIPGDFSIVLIGPKTYAISAASGVNRDDVLKAYSAPALQNAGFHVDIAQPAFPAGDYAITLVQTANGQSVGCDSPNKLHVE